MFNKLNRVSHPNSQGFTLIELVIIIAILGILAAVVIVNIPYINVGSYIATANDEVAKVKTASHAYAAGKNGVYPADSSELSGYFNNAVKGKYIFNTATGDITGFENGGWPSSITFDTVSDQWKRN